jgi:hypothetical protein
MMVLMVDETTLYMGSAEIINVTSVVHEDSQIKLLKSFPSKIQSGILLTSDSVMAVGLTGGDVFLLNKDGSLVKMLKFLDPASQNRSDHLLCSLSNNTIVSVVGGKSLAVYYE